jgi:PilZ domain
VQASRQSDDGSQSAAVLFDSDRRAHPRLSARGLRWLRAARLHHGPTVKLIDLSVGGALLESDVGLRPGSTLGLELVSENPVMVPLRVVRCQVTSLVNKPVYRAACAFTRPIDLPDLLLESFPAGAAHAQRGARGEPSTGWMMLILRYVDGSLLKGFCNDFSASRSHVHLWPSVSAAPSERMIVPISRLKAVFFVREFGGNPGHVDRQAFDGAAHGRKMEVTFLDGEVLVGSTLTYRPEGKGFFLHPADAGSNNTRIFVVTNSVRHARFI